MSHQDNIEEEVDTSLGLKAPVSSVAARRLRPVNIIARLTATAVFPLLWVGAGVTSKDAGMAFPDWPTSDGYVLNPPGWTKANDTLWEHGHRLIGWGVGMLAIALAVVAWREGGIIRTLGWCTLLAIIVQGVLGGIRVTEDSRWLAMIHGIWGQLCFCLAAVTALSASSSWQSLKPPSVITPGRVLRRLSIAVSAVIFVQLILGATLRHLGSDHAWVAHILWAVVVIFLTGWIVMWIVGAGGGPRILRRLAGALGLLMVVQLFLGGTAWLVTMAPQDSSTLWVWLIPTAHVSVGAFALTTSVLLMLVIHRAIHPLPSSQDHKGILAASS